MEPTQTQVPGLPGSNNFLHGRPRENAPNSVSALVLGIVSLSAMAVGGWIVAIIALNHARHANEAIALEPDRYSEGSVRMARAGQKMGKMGLIFGLLGILVWALYFTFIFLIIYYANSTSHYNHY